MNYQIKQNPRSRTFGALVMGICACGLILIGGAMLVTYLLLSEKVSYTLAYAIMPAIVFAAAFVGGLLSIKNRNKNDVLDACICAVTCVVLVLVIDVLLFDGVSVDIWGGVVAILLGVFGALIICTKRGRKASYTKRRSS